MSSIIKVGKVQSSTGQDAIEIANDGHIQNALTLDGGITNAGTISAGTLGSSVVVPASIGGSLVYLTQSSGSSIDNVSLENVMTDTSYKYYIVKGSFQPIVDSQHIYMRWGYGGDSTSWHDAGNYTYTSSRSYAGSSTGHTERNNNTQNTALYMSDVTSTTANSSTDPKTFFEYTFFEPWNTTREKTAYFYYAKWEQNDHMIASRGAVRNSGAQNAGAITAFKIYAGSGDITGDMQLYGLKAS